MGQGPESVEGLRRYKIWDGLTVIPRPGRAGGAQPVAGRERVVEERTATRWQRCLWVRWEPKFWSNV
jgi:hypothetical protein